MFFTLLIHMLNFVSIGYYFTIWSISLYFVHNFKIYFKNITSGPGGLRRYMKKLCSKKEHASGQKNRGRLVYVFKNWKLLFENICGNTCGWKSALKYVKCCLKTENGCLKTLTKHPQTVRFSKYVVIFILLSELVLLSYNQFCN